MRRFAGAMVLAISVLLTSCELVGIVAPKSTKFPLATLTDVLDSTSGPPAGSSFHGAKELGQTLFVLYGNYQTGKLELLEVAPGATPIRVSFPDDANTSKSQLLISDGQVFVVILAPKGEDTAGCILKVEAIDAVAGTASLLAPALDLPEISIWSIAISGKRAFFSGGDSRPTGSWQIYEYVSSGETWSDMTSSANPQAGYDCVRNALFVSGDGNLHKIAYSSRTALAEYSLVAQAWQFVRTVPVSPSSPFVQNEEGVTTVQSIGVTALIDTTTDNLRKYVCPGDPSRAWTSCPVGDGVVYLYALALDDLHLVHMDQDGSSEFALPMGDDLTSSLLLSWFIPLGKDVAYVCNDSHGNMRIVRITGIGE